MFKLFMDKASAKTDLRLACLPETLERDRGGRYPPASPIFNETQTCLAGSYLLNFQMLTNKTN